MDISTELDIAVSGAKVSTIDSKELCVCVCVCVMAMCETVMCETVMCETVTWCSTQDGTCIIHTVRRGHYMHTLLPCKDRHKCVVCHAHISSLGRLLVYTEDKQARSKVS